MEWNVDNPDIMLIPTSGSSEAFSIIGKDAFHFSSTIVMHKKLITQTRSWENYVKHQEGAKRPWYTQPSPSASCCTVAGNVCAYRLSCYWLLNVQKGNPHIQRESHEWRRRCSSFFSEGGKEVGCIFSPRCGKWWWRMGKFLVKVRTPHIPSSKVCVYTLWHVCVYTVRTCSGNQAIYYAGPLRLQFALCLWWLFSRQCCSEPIRVSRQWSTTSLTLPCTPPCPLAPTE